MEVVQDLNSHGEESVPFVPFAYLARTSSKVPEDHSIFPISGISLKQTVLCNESGKWANYFSDRFGFNNPEKMYSLDSIEIAIVGDSFAHGACVDPGVDTAGILRSAGYGVMNYGISGNGPLAELASMKEYAVHLKPKVVLWMYYSENDLSNLVAEYGTELKRYLEENFS